MGRNYNVIAFISKYLTRLKEGSFTDVIKIETIFIKITFQDLKL